MNNRGLSLTTTIYTMAYAAISMILLLGNNYIDESAIVINVLINSSLLVLSIIATVKISQKSGGEKGLILSIVIVSLVIVGILLISAISAPFLAEVFLLEILFRIAPIITGIIFVVKSNQKITKTTSSKNNKSSLTSKLTELVELRDQGLINEEEFAIKRAEIIEKY